MYVYYGKLQKLLHNLTVCCYTYTPINHATQNYKIMILHKTTKHNTQNKTHARILANLSAENLIMQVDNDLRQ